MLRTWLGIFSWPILKRIIFVSVLLSHLCMIAIQKLSPKATSTPALAKATPTLCAQTMDSKPIPPCNYGIIGHQACHKSRLEGGGVVAPRGTMLRMGTINTATHMCDITNTQTF